MQGLIFSSFLKYWKGCRLFSSPKGTPRKCIHVLKEENPDPDTVEMCRKGLFLFCVYVSLSRDVANFEIDL